MSFVSSHAGSVIYPESSSGSNIIYAAPSSSYGHPHHQAHYASAPGSYYGHYHAAPMQHNFYGAPPSMMMPGHGGYMAPAPAYHRSSYSAPYGYGSPYPAYGAAQPTVIVSSGSRSSSRHHHHRHRSSSSSRSHRRYYY